MTFTKKTKTNPESLECCWSSLSTSETPDLRTGTNILRETHVWAGMFAKLEPFSFPETPPSFIFRLRLRAGECISESVALIIDSRSDQHPAWSGCSAAAFWAVNVCAPAILSYSTISKGGMGGWGGGSRDLTLNQEPMVCGAKWEIRVCFWPFGWLNKNCALCR